MFQIKNIRRLVFHVGNREVLHLIIKHPQLKKHFVIANKKQMQEIFKYDLCLLFESLNMILYPLKFKLEKCFTILELIRNPDSFTYTLGHIKDDTFFHSLFLKSKKNHFVEMIRQPKSLQIIINTLDESVFKKKFFVDCHRKASTSISKEDILDLIKNQKSLKMISEIYDVWNLIINQKVQNIQVRIMIELIRHPESFRIILEKTNKKHKLYLRNMLNNPSNKIKKELHANELTQNILHEHCVLTHFHTFDSTKSSE